MRFSLRSCEVSLLMEHQPEWACVCERASCAITPRSQWAIIGPPFVLIKGLLSRLLTSSYFSILSHFPCVHLSMSMHPPPRHPPTLRSPRHYLVDFSFSMWLVACQHPIITSSVLVAPPPTPVSCLLSSMSTDPPASPRFACQSHNDPNACFFSLLILGGGGQKKTGRRK